MVRNFYPLYVVNCRRCNEMYHEKDSILDKGLMENRQISMRVAYSIKDNF